MKRTPNRADVATILARFPAAEQALYRAHAVEGVGLDALSTRFQAPVADVRRRILTIRQALAASFQEPS